MNENEKKVNEAETQKEKVTLKQKFDAKKAEIKEKREAKKAEREGKPGIGKKILVGAGIATAVAAAAFATIAAGKRNSDEVDPDFETEPGDYELDDLVDVEETPVEEKTEE